MLNLLSAEWKQMLRMLGLQNSSKFHQIQKVCLKLAGEKQMKYLPLEPSKNLSSLQLSAAKSLVHIKNLRGYLKVLNPTGKDISIPQNKVLAVVSEIDSNSINHFNAGFKNSNV